MFITLKKRLGQDTCLRQAHLFSLRAALSTRNTFATRRRPRRHACFVCDLFGEAGETATLSYKSQILALADDLRSTCTSSSPNSAPEPRDSVECSCHRRNSVDIKKGVYVIVATVGIEWASVEVAEERAFRSVKSPEEWRLSQKGERWSH